MTRVSFGLQSTQAHVLAGLGRRNVPHAAETIAAAVHDAGFATWNLDLIFGAAAESDDDWAATLDARPRAGPSAAAPQRLRPDRRARHPAGRRRRRAIPTTTTQARRYEQAEAVLTAAGYRWEEISNWARPGHECRHNHLYWEQGDYVGIGSAAHSHRAGTRWWNVRTPDRYIDAIEAGRSPEAGREELTAEQRDFEALSLSLRTPRGVPWAGLERPEELDGPRGARSTAGPCSPCGAGCWPTRSAPESAPVSCTDDRDRRGARGCHRRPDGEGGAALPPPRLHLPLGRDLRRLPLHLRLRPARGQHAAQRQERLVARHGAGARRRGRPRRRHPRPARHLGRLGPPGHLHRPPGRLQELPRALAGGQDRRRLPQLRLQGPDRGPGLQPHVQDPRRPGRGRGPRGLPAPRDGPGHVHQLRQRARHDAQEAALRHRPGRQVLPQRDHAAELRLPHPRVRADGDGVLRPARRAPSSGSSTGWRSA